MHNENIEIDHHMIVAFFEFCQILIFEFCAHYGAQKLFAKYKRVLAFQNLEKKKKKSTMKILKSTTI